MTLTYLISRRQRGIWAFMTLRHGFIVQAARWVAYPRAGIAVEELERRFHYPTSRMPHASIRDSGMGNR
jgi:hypothetical protein